MERKGNTNLLQSLFFVLVVILAGFILLRSPVFEIRHVQVNGNNFLNQAKIKELSGITLGTNIFKQNFAFAVNKIALNPMVKRVEINRRFPSTVEINLVERIASALVPYSQGFIQVDGEGFYLAKIELTGKANLPFVTGINSVTGTLGKKINSSRLEAALQYLKDTPQSFKDQISEINASDEDNLVLYTVMGFPVKLGDTDRVKEKVHLFQEIVSANSPQKIEYLDLSIRKPVIKYLDPERPGE